jgi:hypothetical protein
MVTMLEDYTTKEQCSFVHLLWANGLVAKHIHKEMVSVYGGKCLWHKTVCSWVEKFSPRMFESCR